MVEKEPPQDEPSLEMPSLSLRRKRKLASTQPESAPVADEGAPQPSPARVRRPARGVVRLPALTGLVAALVTGAVVGGLAVLLVWLATSACGAVRGTSSCGGGPGLLILVATLVLLAYLGGLMLRAFGVAEPGSTGLLGVGVMAVVVLAFFSQVLDETWMVAVVPLVAMAAFALAWWVTLRAAQR